MESRRCLVCGKVHSFRVPKFLPGTVVRIIGTGVHHNDEVGSTVCVMSQNTILTEPCDEPEYFTSLGGGSISEGRPVDATEYVVHADDGPNTKPN